MNGKTHANGRSGALRALLLGALLAAAGPLHAKDVYKGYLDPGLPHHRAILDTLERLKAAPNDAGLHNDLGCLVAWDGFWRDALREFDLAAKLDKGDSRPLFNSGLVEAWRGRWSAARGDFATAKKRSPGNWPAWWMLGYCEEMLGNDEAAVDAYKVSTRVDTSLFQVASNPFAAGTRLKTRVLLETYERRLVRASMPARQEFSAPDRIASFFQRATAPVPAAPKAEAEESVGAGPTGPVVTTAPSTSSAPPSPRSDRERPGRPFRRPPRQPQPDQDPNVDQAAPVPPPEELPLNPVTPAPPKKQPLQPVMGPGGAPQTEE